MFLGALFRFRNHFIRGGRFGHQCSLGGTVVGPMVTKPLVLLWRILICRLLLTRSRLIRDRILAGAAIVRLPTDRTTLFIANLVVLVGSFLKIWTTSILDLLRVRPSFRLWPTAVTALGPSLITRTFRKGRRILLAVNSLLVTCPVALTGTVKFNFRVPV